MTEATGNPRLVTLKKVRLSFTDSLRTAKATVSGGVPKHSCNLLLESDGAEFEANKAKVISALKAAGEQEWGKEDMFKQIAENKPDRVAFRKGEKFCNQETGEVYKGYAGNWAIPCSGPGGSKNPKRPVILDRAKKPVWHPDKGAENLNRILDVCYSGCYADVKVEFYPVSGSDNGGNGIFASLQVIRSREEGDRMGGGYTFTDEELDDFEDLEDDFDAAGGSSDGDDDFG